MPRADCLVLLATATALGCNDIAGPPARLAGTYVASSFWLGHVVGADVVETNQLIRGATLTIILTADGYTDGTLFQPGGNADGSDLHASMVGTWSVHNDSVYFAQPARTFMRAIPFVIESSSLRAFHWTDTTLVRVTLRRTQTP